MHFIAVSAAPAQAARLAALLPQAAALIGAAPGAPVEPGATAWLAAAALPVVDDGALVLVGRQPALIGADGHRHVALAAVAQRWHGLGCPPHWPASVDFTPPFALALFDRRRAQIRVVTDAIGLSHVYVTAQDGITAASSSALALARLFGRGPDLAALFAMAQTGSMVGTDTAFAGVRKLGAGECATLHHGKLELLAPPAADTAANRPEPLAASAAHGAAILRTIVTELAEAEPGAEFELSGGLDSRLLLAALPAPLRAARRGFTIGTATAPDAVVARQIAAQQGMVHDVVDAAEVLAATDFDALLLSVTHDHEFSANPLDRALIAALGARYAVPRFSGQNGEALRGFYYAGQRLAATPTPALAQRLVDWRLLSNDAVDPALFVADFETAARAALRARLTQLVLDCPGTGWAARLDSLYERERMQHWCGIGISGIQHRRQILMPFFDARMTAFARAADPQTKAGAQLAAAMLVELDPGLAGLRLDSGLAPAALAAGGARSLVARAGVTGAKAARKIGQRLRRAPADTMAATGAAARFRAGRGEGGGAGRIDVAPLHDWGIFEPAMLDRFASGVWQPDRPTLGFLINCAALAAALGPAGSAKLGSGSGARNRLEGLPDGVAGMPAIAAAAAASE